jgi:hypothetical protein
MKCFGHGRIVIAPRGWCGAARLPKAGMLIAATLAATENRLPIFGLML